MEPVDEEELVEFSEDDQDLAIHFFIAFYALCYASLAEYTRFTETV